MNDYYHQQTQFRKTYENDFSGMTNRDVSYEDLIHTRDTLIQTIHKTLTYDERKFLLSLKMGVPQWELLNVPNIETFPAIQWKLLNIKKMDKIKHQSAVENLGKILGL